MTKRGADQIGVPDYTTLGVSGRKRGPTPGVRHPRLYLLDRRCGQVRADVVTRCRGQRCGRRHDQAQEGRTKFKAPSFSNLTQVSREKRTIAAAHHHFTPLSARAEARWRPASPTTSRHGLSGCRGRSGSRRSHAVTSRRVAESRGSRATGDRRTHQPGFHALGALALRLRQVGGIAEPLILKRRPLFKRARQLRSRTHKLRP